MNSANNEQIETPLESVLTGIAMMVLCVVGPYALTLLAAYMQTK
ncbi:TPA: hypothetical protein ACX6NV_000579 [Photobacterium damselae]